jgi:shikimate kinase
MGACFADTDALIESGERMTVRQIFDLRGEGYFRALERETVARTGALSGTVIATGGGVVKDPLNVEAMRRNGLVVWLNADEKFISRNTDDGIRPLLANISKDKRLETIRRMLMEREPLYRAACHIVLDVTDLTPDEAADAILQKISQKSEREKP